MSSQFEQALKVASYIGAQQAYNRIRERHGLEKSAAPIAGGAMGALPLINAIIGAIKSKEGERLSGAGRGAMQGLGQMGGGILGGLAGLLTGPGAILGVPAGLGAGAYGGDKLMSKLLGGDPEYRKEASGMEKKAFGAGTLLGLLHGAVTGPEGEKGESIGHGMARGIGADLGIGLGGTAGTGIGMMLAAGAKTPQQLLLRAILPSLAGAGAGGYGGYKIMDKLMGETPREKKASVLSLAAKTPGVSNAFSNVLKSPGGKAALLGTGLLGTAGASAYGGAQYGKNKTIDTIRTNMDNQGFMDRLKTIFQYLMGNTGAVMQNLGLPGNAPTGV